MLQYKYYILHDTHQSHMVQVRVLKATLLTKDKALAKSATEAAAHQEKAKAAERESFSLSTQRRKHKSESHICNFFCRQ